MSFKLFLTFVIAIFSLQLSSQTYTSYAVIKEVIQSQKQQHSSSHISPDSLSNIFTFLLTEKIIPHWLTTRWSFEGHTSIPREGEIACGYFVSTTLRDMGFNLNRYTFAQQLPIHEAKTLNLGTAPLEINSTSTAERIQLLKSTLKEGIYFIGFDQSHVGYIQKKHGELFIIHSNYINAEGVVIEKIEDSQVFSFYNKIYIAEISTNIPLMKKWLKSEAIHIVTSN